MAHSHDRTLLSSLGFSDPDKKDPTHDKVCRYLAYGCPVDLMIACGQTPRITRGKTEVMLTKGEGKYKTTIGFLDVVVRSYAKYGEDLCHDAHCAPVVAEVKVNKVSVGDILRQMNLYREFFSDRLASWCVVTCFDLQSQEVEQLSQESIHWLRLSTKFDRWLEFQATECATPTPTFI